MQSAYLWQLWPGRHWPLSPDEEELLLEELRELGGEPAPFDRGDATAVLNMIRLGISFKEVHPNAPGLRPARLLAAYDYLEQRRDESEVAFEAILANPAPDVFHANGPLSTRLVPIPTFWLSRAINEGSETSARQVSEYLHQEVRSLASAVAIVEHQLVTDTPASGPRCDEYIRLGRTLYNPYEECLWARPFYVPTRVGALMPPRVADLLGEIE